MPFYKSILLIITGLILIAACYGIGSVVTNKKSFISKFDSSVSKYVLSTETPQRTELAKKITRYGDWDIIVYITIISTIIMIFFNNWKVASSTAFGLLIINTATNYLKNFFDSSRPTEMLGSAGGFSFPSGHTTSIIILCFMISWFLVTSISNKWINKLGLIIVMLAGLLVGASRIFLNVHWFSDVIGGVLLSIGVGLTIVGIIEIISKKSRKKYTHSE